MSGSHGRIGSSGGSAMPASRCNASRTCIPFCASCASYARSWNRQPPQAGKCSHGASTRSGPGRSTSVASASAWLRLTFVTRARTRSPGSPRRTKTTKPSSRATPLPPYASESTSSSSSSPFVTGAATSGQRRDEDLALARTVELAEEDALVRAEREARVPQGAQPLQQGEIDAISADADRFIAEMDEETYLHFSGQKETYELGPIYERHERLTQLDTALALGASVDGDRRRRELWKFACEGYLGNFVSEEAERVAELEATLTASVDGEEIPYRMLKPRLMNEEDRDVRARVEAARNELTEEHLNT